MLGNFSLKTKKAIVLQLAAATLLMSFMPLLPTAQADNPPPVNVNALPIVSSIVANVSAQRIYHMLYDMQNFSTRYIPTPNCNASAEYIVNDFSNSSNLIVHSQYFLYSGFLLRNVVAILPAFNPANKTVYVLGGHYDSWAQNNPMVWAPGVDDDASGTVATMEVARVLSQYKFNATLAFGAWTAEEVGLVGSQYYASKARSDGMEIGAMIQMDMIGNYATTFGMDLAHDGYSEWIADALIAANTDYGIGLALQKYYSTGRGSDHASFWDEGYNAILMIESDFSPHWHQDTDTIDNVNISLITGATQIAAAALAELAGIIPPGTGAIALDKTVYKPGDFAGVTLYDTDLNTNPSSPDATSVMIYSDTEPIGEVVSLTETGPDTSIFTGQMELILGPPSAGQLEVTHNDTILAEYIDADPPGVRTASALVDAIPPSIWDVFAVPDVDFATVYWKTDEPSDSTVYYGETPALGLQATVSNLVTDHSVLLTGLTPKTRYFYDVASADPAGNTVISDNGGNHYTFFTLSGSIGRPEYGYVGYVKSNDPTGNYFTAPEMIVGQGVQGTYLGAAQLNTSAYPIPPTAVITKATFEALGIGWIYQAPGQWSLKLLNSSADAGWTTKGYTLINAASVDATILPVLNEFTVIDDEWNVFTFQPGQYDLLRGHVDNGRISFRMDGPRAGMVIYTWYTGNAGGGIDITTMPRLKVVYSTTGDVTGPLVETLYANPNPTMLAPSTTIHVTISDMSTGGSNLTYAEYFWGPDPGIGNAMPLFPDDGGYDSPVENATMYVDVSSMPRGVYTLGFRGRDEAENWGLTETLTLYVGIWDLYPPQFDSISFNPLTPESGFPTNISVRITDDIAVYGAWLNIVDFGGNPRGNYSMLYDPMMDRYYQSVAYGQLGTYRATVWANDTSNRWNSTTATYDIVDTTAPVIVQMTATPPLQNYGMPIIFNAWVTDKFLDFVKITFEDPTGIPQGNFTAMQTTGDNYTHLRSFTTFGTWKYCFYAEDLSGNSAFSCDFFTITDGYPPIILAVEAQPLQQSYDQDVTIRAWVTDDYLDTVSVVIVGPDTIPIGNFTMTRVSPFQDNWTYADKFSTLGQYVFTVWAFDQSGNNASANSFFRIVDRVPPIFDAVQVTPNPVEVYNWVKVSAQVSDLQAVTVYCEFTGPTGGVLRNMSMAFNATSGYFEDALQVQTLGTHGFKLLAVDQSDNKALVTGDFLAIDSTKPQITFLGLTRLLAEDHNHANVSFSIEDNYELDTDSLRIEWRTPTDVLITNQSLAPSGASQFYSLFSLDVQGMNRYTVMACDSNSNCDVYQGLVEVVLGLPPVAEAGSDANIVLGENLVFNGSASSDDFGITRYVWSIIGPETNVTIEGIEVNHTFTITGTFSVTLTVYDGANRMSTDTLTVTVASNEPTGIDPIVFIFIAFLVIVIIAFIMLFITKRKKDDSEIKDESTENQEESV